MSVLVEDTAYLEHKHGCLDYPVFVAADRNFIPVVEPRAIQLPRGPSLIPRSRAT